MIPNELEFTSFPSSGFSIASCTVLNWLDGELVNSESFVLFLKSQILQTNFQNRNYLNILRDCIFHELESSKNKSRKLLWWVEWWLRWWVKFKRNRLFFTINVLQVNPIRRIKIWLTVKSRTVEQSTIQFWSLLAKGHST